MWIVVKKKKKKKKKKIQLPRVIVEIFSLQKS